MSLLVHANTLDLPVGETELCVALCLLWAERREQPPFGEVSRERVSEEEADRRVSPSEPWRFFRRDDLHFCATGQGDTSGTEDLGTLQVMFSMNYILINAVA